MNQQQALLDYTLRMADTAVVMGHRCGEWCGHGPVLEQDIALTNIALDHIGQARSLYQYAATQFNKLSKEEKAQAQSSTQLQTLIDTGASVDEDDFAYLRDVWDFKNVLLVEQPNRDWAYTVARSFYLDAFNYFFYTELLQSNDTTLAAIAEKSLKEVTYHLRWSSEWVIRLGDGTDESHIRMQNAIDDYWAFTGELMTPNETDSLLLNAGIGADLEKIKPLWQEHIAAILKEATLTMPKQLWMQQGGKDGRHSEYLVHLLADFQFMQRAYPNMEW